MRKWLAIFGLLVLIGVAAGQQTPTGTPKQSIPVQEPSHKGQEQPQAQGNYNPTANPIPAAPQPPAPTADKSGQNSSQDGEINRWLMYFTGALVVVGILQFGGMVWQAILLRNTRRDVGRQADWMETQAGHMNDQTQVLRDSVAAAKDSAKAAFLQIQMVQEKERARVEIKATGLELQHEGDEFWNLKAGIELRNVGAGRAYIRQGTGRMILEVPGNPEEEVPAGFDYWGPLSAVDGFIDPNGEPLAEPFYFFQTEKLNLAEYARNICDGTFSLSLRGYVEYETVGTRFHRDFDYVWMGSDNPGNIGARLTFSEEFKPTNDSERISFGFWNQELFGKNEEYEIPKKKEKKAN